RRRAHAAASARRGLGVERDWPEPRCARLGPRAGHAERPSDRGTGAGGRSRVTRGSPVISFSSRTRVFAWSEPVDMRKGYEGLSELVRRALGQGVLSGDLYLFVGRTRRRA